MNKEFVADVGGMCGKYFKRYEWGAHAMQLAGRDVVVIVVTEKVKK